MQAEQKIRKAVAALVLEQPFYASLLLRLKIQASPRVDFMGVDGVHLFFNASANEWDSMSMPVLKGVLCHEVMHVANAHHCRRNGRDPCEWNEATDYAINPIVRASGFTLPDNVLIDDEFDGMSAESIFDIRRKRRQDDDGQNEQPQDGEDAAADDAAQGGDARPDESDSRSDDENATDADDGDSAPSSGTPNAIPNDATQQSSNSGGVGNFGGCGEIMDYPGDNDDGSPPSPAQLAEQESEWKIAMAQAAQAARAAGNLPGDIAMMVDDLLDPKMPWQDLLREWMTRISKDDYTWIPPNRRYVASGLYLPSAYSESLGDIVICIDASGSLWRTDMQSAFATEVRHIVQDVRPENVHVIYFDSRVTSHETYSPDDFPETLEPKGGGGTAFAPVFDFIEQHDDIEPECCVFFTDMYAGDWDRCHEPEFPVLFADYAGGEVNAPFGEHIIIDA